MIPEETFFVRPAHAYHHSGNTNANTHGPAAPLPAADPTAKRAPFWFSAKCQDDDKMPPVYYGYRYYNRSTGRWISRDPLGDWSFLLSYATGPGKQQQRALISASLEPCYEFVLNSPVNQVDQHGLRRLGFAGQIYVWRNNCAKCPELLKNYRYIDEDSPGLKPLKLGSHDADALYVPVGIALKIGDTGIIHVDCDCCTHCVKITPILPPIYRWELQKGSTHSMVHERRNPSLKSFPGVE